MRLTIRIASQHGQTDMEMRLTIRIASQHGNEVDNPFLDLTRPMWPCQVKATFSVFLSLFLVKLSKYQCLKLNISRTPWPILMILVSFCRILNGLSDEIRLFWRCSSPLKVHGEMSNNSNSTYIVRKEVTLRSHFLAKMQKSTQMH